MATAARYAVCIESPELPIDRVRSLLPQPAIDLLERRGVASPDPISCLAALETGDARDLARLLDEAGWTRRPGTLRECRVPTGQPEREEDPFIVLSPVLPDGTLTCFRCG